MPSPPDERDYTVANVHMTVSPLPESYKKTGMSVLNQGSIGSCVAHSIATAMGYGELKATEDENGKGGKAHDFSRGFLYGNRNDNDWQGEGMYIRQALKHLNHEGDCLYADFKFNKTYPQVKALIDKDRENLFSKALPYKVLNYFRLYTQEEIKIALLNQGAIIVGMPIYSSFKSNCPLPTKNDKREGGHAMCLVGWDKTGWIIQNSWSSFWGDNGYVHVPYDYPFDEWWGITVNPDVPTPEKKSFIKRLFNKIVFGLSWCWAKIKRLFRRS